MRHYDFRDKYITNRLFVEFCEKIRDPQICVLDSYKLRTSKMLHWPVTVVERDFEVHLQQCRRRTPEITCVHGELHQYLKPHYNCVYFDFTCTFHGARHILHKFLHETHRSNIVFAITFCTRARCTTRETIHEIRRLINSCDFHIYEFKKHTYRGSSKKNKHCGPPMATLFYRIQI
jgi:hypothetical protein